MSTPTAAAMRAAAELANACFGMRSQRGEPLLAEIVDRTTGLPELIAALRNVLSSYKTLNWGHPDDEIANCNIRLADEALHKAEGRS